MENGTCVESEHARQMLELCGADVRKWWRQHGSAIGFHFLMTALIRDQLGEIHLTIKKVPPEANPKTENFRITASAWTVVDGQKVIHGDNGTGAGLTPWHAALANLAADLLENGKIGVKKT